VEGYTEALFVPPMPLRADDKFNMDMVATADAKSELHRYWKLWGLEDASLIGDFVMLSSNAEKNPKRDFVTDKFSRGRGTCKFLFDYCCFATACIAPLPSNCVWVDLVFSQIKNAQNSNESEESPDRILVYIINDLHRDRNERREVLHGYPSGVGLQSTYTRSRR
jgi:hypothetical protein